MFSIRCLPALARELRREGLWQERERWRQVCSADVRHVDTSEEGERSMATIVHRGIKLAYDDRGAGKRAFVFVHG